MRVAWNSRSGAYTVTVLAALLALGAAAVAQSVVLVAAGTSLPEPLFQNWNFEYVRTNPRMTVRYLPMGTEEGARQMEKGVADLGEGDYPLTTQDGATRGKVIQVPLAVAGIAVVCNVPGVTQELNLSGPVLADIFLSKITVWNHPEIAKLNPGVALPATGILVLHRSEGKGANYIFTDYLSRVSTEFRTRIGRGLAPKWVTGTSLARGEDVLFQVKDTAGAIGYVELNLAMRAGAPLAHIRNADGLFVRPTPESVAAAAQADAAEALRGAVMNAPGRESYPISSFTWLYVPEKGKDENTQRAVKNYVLWLLETGQLATAKLGFAPLPPAVAAKARAKIEALQ